MIKSFLYWQVTDGPQLHMLSTRMRKSYNTIADPILCRRGRIGIQIALLSAGLAKGDEVIIPSFCCESIILPIMAIGATPVYADIGDELNITAETVGAVISRRTRAVVVPHLFGNPAEIDKINNLCTERGIAVIDDAAQATGSTYKNHLLGTFGDYGILSFGNGKICFGIGGGILLSKNKENMISARKIELKNCSVRDLLREASEITIWRRWRRKTLPISVALKKLFIEKRKKYLHFSEKMGNIQAAVAITLLDTLNENLKARKARVNLYQKLLSENHQIRLIAHRDGSACLSQVIEIKTYMQQNKDITSEIIGKLKLKGFEIAGSYVPLNIKKEYKEFEKGNLSITNSVWKKLIELPCEPSVPLLDVEKISTIINKILI